MVEVLFYLFALMTLVPALLLVTSRNAVNGAMFMIVSFVGTAALFALLQAYLLAILQVLVYAGAVVVLFLFIIMLLNVAEMKTHRMKVVTWSAAMFSFLLLATGAIAIFASGRGGPSPEGIVEAPASLAARFGYSLFTKYMLPFQLAGFLLLAAMLGVIYLSKKQSAATQRVAAAPSPVAQDR